MSIGGPSHQYLISEAFFTQIVEEYGVLLVAASGNDGMSNCCIPPPIIAYCWFLQPWTMPEFDGADPTMANKLNLVRPPGKPPSSLDANHQGIMGASSGTATV
jgi:hypothetical protein